jgi:hypothetical protein
MADRRANPCSVRTPRGPLHAGRKLLGTDELAAASLGKAGKESSAFYITSELAAIFLGADFRLGSLALDVLLVHQGQL